MTEPTDEGTMQLGRMVAVWAVEQHPTMGRVFDLHDMEESAVDCFDESADTLCDQMTFDAFSLPVGSYVIVCFPDDTAVVVEDDAHDARPTGIQGPGSTGDEQRGTGLPD